MSRRLAIVLACAAAIALLAAIAIRPRSSPGPVEAPAAPVEDARDVVAMPAEAPEREAAVATGEAVVAGAPSTVLLVRAISKSTRKPLPRVRLTVSPKLREVPSKDVESSRGSFTESPVTDADGRAEIAVEPDVELFFWARGKEARAESGPRDVPPLRAGERREMVLELATEADLRFHGRAIRKSDGAPVPGARVRALTTDDLDPPGTVIAEATSALDGLFAVDLPSWRAPHLRVEAAGFGFAVVTPGKGHETPDLAHPVRLADAAAIEARVLDAAGSPLAGAVVRLTASSFQVRRASEDELSPLIGIPDEFREATAGEDGRCALRELPAGVSFTLEIHREGALLRREAAPIVLAPGQVLEREWRIGAGGTFAGLVVDQEEKPVANLELWLAAAPAAPGMYFQAFQSATAAAKTTSDAEGRFAFRDVAAGAWAIGPSPGTFDGPSPGDVAPRTERFEMEGSGTKEITLRVFRAIYIRGTVLDPAGKPQPNAYVWALDGGLTGLQAESREDGSFALGPLHVGRYELIAIKSGSGAPSEKVDADSGQEGVVLRLRAGGSVRGRVVDARTGEGCKAQMRVTLEDPRKGWSEHGVGWTNTEDGAFDTGDLEPGLYGISASTRDGRFGVLRGVGVAAGEETGGLVVAISPGGTIRCRYEGSRSKVMLTVHHQGVPIGWSEPLPAERLVPAGTVVLHLRTEDDQDVATRTVEIDAGETEEVVFRDGD